MLTIVYTIPRIHASKSWTGLKSKKGHAKRHSPQTSDSSDGTGDLAGTQATGAGVNSLRGTIHNSLYAFDVRLPSPIGTSVRVGYLNTEGNALPADITFCHRILHLL